MARTTKTTTILPREHVSQKKEQIEPPDRDVASMFRPTRVVTGIIKPGISLNGLVGCPLLPVHS